jgi:hypothetical protein
MLLTVKLTPDLVGTIDLQVGAPRPARCAPSGPRHAEREHCAALGDAAGRHSANTPTGRSATLGRSARPHAPGDADRQSPSKLESAVELRLGEKRAGQLEDLVGLAQLPHFALQGLEALLLDCVKPSRWPVSRSCWRTQRRKVSAVQPILPAIDTIAAHCESYSILDASNTMRTARSTTSGENLVDLFMAPSSQKLEPPQNPGRFT